MDSWDFGRLDVDMCLLTYDRRRRWYHFPSEGVMSGKEEIQV
jgi:hypothetical protein